MKHRDMQLIWILVGMPILVAVYAFVVDHKMRKTERAKTAEGKERFISIRDQDERGSAK